LLAAIIATMLVRRAILRTAQAIDARAPLTASGSLGALGASVNRLLEQVNENEVVLRRRTLELESANKELEAFTFSASHDLRAPLASIDGFTQMLIEDCGTQLDDMARDCVHWIRDACAQMQELVEGLLQMSRFSRADLEREEVDLSQLAHAIADNLRQREPHRNVDVRIQEGVVVNGDRRLLRAVLENLLSNAWKFTGKRPHATIEFGVTNQNGRSAIYVRDDGAGFDPGYADKMFRAFQRLHTRQEFEGTGIGLATVERILHRHGGKIWAEGEVEKGATFYFTTAHSS
jgi:light-regulated signal transduction histidine kinase (bacteriophytochrome)